MLCADLLGWTPRDVDRHSFRDIWIAVAGARRREVRGWQQPLAIAQAIWNWGGPRGRNFKPKPLGELHEKMFPDFHGKAVPKMSLEEYHERVRKIEDALRERYREERADP